MAQASRFLSPARPDEAASTRVGPVSRARASLRALEAADRISAQGGNLSPGDLDELSGWAGWGPMAPAFSTGRSGTWREIGERLEWLLPPDQLREAQQATPNAFYTPPRLAVACWQILRDLGFTGGRVLEPGCGAGAFMAAAPAGVPVAWTGVERDPVTAQIAGLLHPSAVIVNERLQNAALPAHSMDAVIGNVPFGETPVYDPTAPKPVTKSLHNYCIWRSARTLRPGGVAVLITSRYTMDARDTAVREAIAAEADLLGAIRLPGEALSPGGTEVVTDILVLRRRDGREPPSSQAWIETVLLAETHPAHQWTYDDRVNQWFVTHPGMVLGEFRPDHAARYGRTVRVDRPADARPVEEALADTAKGLVAGARSLGLAWDLPAAVVPDAGDVGIPQRADGRKELSFHLIGGAAFQVRDGALVPAGRQGKELAELTALIGMRDAAVELLDAEADYGRGEESLAPLRARLNAAYDRYLAAYGPLNRATITTGEPDPETGISTVSRRRPRMAGFRQDPDYVTVLALENYEDETGQAAKTAIFSRRVNQRPTRPTRAETPGEAIRVCLDTRGRLDLTVIGELLGISAGQVAAELKDLAYLDPASGDWVTAEEYLSGNVRDKLTAARAAASSAADSAPADWPANIAALERVQPADLGPDEIRAKLGAPWIPAGDVAAFAAETLGYPPAVSYIPVTAQWEVKIERGLADTAAATEEWGTSRIDGYRLLELAVNGKAPVIYDTVTTPDGETRVRNQAETMLAEDKQRALAARFGEWAWEDPQRCDRLCAEYNRRFNSVVLRRHDGSHLTFPGLVAGFSPYPHQLDMVHRIVSAQASLCPYPVGTGKTPTMFLAARKLKELGLASKPLIIVPNHLLEQTAREGKRLFPSARILMAAREDLADARARKLFAARCATGDWDAVVMTHSAFTAIPVHPVTQAAHLTDLAARYRQVLTTEPGGRRTVKQLAKMIDAFETRARTLLDHRTDDGVYFEHLGADFLMVDESHYFKNLGIPVRTDGFSIAASKRATDLDMKLALLRQRGGKVAALFTGTPVSNSLLEMFVLQHYLHPQRLEEVGVHSADAWAATFVEFQTTVEVTPDGASFRLKRRPAKFENVPELLTLFGEVADLRPPGSFAVQRPAARHHAVVITSSPELREYVAGLAERADRVRQVDSHTDNMLKICSDGRKAALDLELVNIASSRPGKVGAVVANVARTYHATRQLALPGDDPGVPAGGFQIVFCDLGTPGAGGSQVYGKIRSGLIAAGVPATRIRFIHDAPTWPRPRSSRTAGPGRSPCCSAPPTSSASGPTSSPGASRCTTSTRPGDPPTSNRGKAALRPGNLNPSVDLYRYVSEKSFDSFMWQTLERKARFIGQVLGGRPVGRDVDDIGDSTLSYAEVKALATGNPLLLELAEVNALVTRLRQLATAHTRATRRLAHSITGWEQQIAAKTRRADDCDRIASTGRDHPDQAWYDHLRRAIPEPEVAGYLARLTSETMAFAGGYSSLSWRGLHISVRADRKWRAITPVATVSAGAADLTVELNPAWTAKGQHWRIEKEIRTAVDGAAGTARWQRDDIDDLRQRVTDAAKRIGEPFPHAAELETARARRDAIEQEIRDAAAPHEADVSVRDGHDHDTASSHEVPDLAGADDAELVTITPVLTWPETTASIDDIAGDGHGLATSVAPDNPPDAAAEQPLAAAAATSEPSVAAGELAVIAAGSQPREVDPITPVEAPPGEPRAPVRAVMNPVSVASLDDAAEPLFPLPATPPGQPAAGKASRARRPARPRGARRAAAQVAACDGAVQPALFDLPEPAAGEPTRPAVRRRSGCP